MTSYLHAKVGIFGGFVAAVSILNAGEFPLTRIIRSEIPAPGRDPGYTITGFYAPTIGRNGMIYVPTYIRYLNPNPPPTPPLHTVDIRRMIYATDTPGTVTWANGVARVPSDPPKTFPYIVSFNATNTSGVSFGRVLNDQALGSGEYGYSTGLGTGSVQALYAQSTPVPGFPGFSFFPFEDNELSQLQHNLNDSGRATFITRIAVSGENTTAGIFTTDTPGVLTQVARTGQTATVEIPQFTSLGEPATTDNGTIIFGAISPGSTSYGIWSRSSTGLLEALVRPGFAVPGSTTGEVFRTLVARDQLAVTADGTTAFGATYGAPGGPDKQGLFMGTPGNLVQITADSAPVLGIAYNALAEVQADTLRLNDNGTLVYNATYFGVVGGTFTSGGAIFTKYRGGALGPIVKSGDQAPGLASGVTFTHFDRYKNALNNNDLLVFKARLAGPGITFGTNSDSYWAMDLTTGNLRLIVQDSDLLEMSPGVTSVSKLYIANELGRFPPRGGGSNGVLSDTGRFVFPVRYADITAGIYSADLTPVGPPVLTRLEQWRQTNFGVPTNTGSGADTFVSGPDLLPNLIRYALGLNAGVNGEADGSAPRATVEDFEGVKYPVLRFIHDPAASDVRLAVSVSNTLALDTWADGNVYLGTNASPGNPLTTELSRTPLPDGRELITVRGNEAVNSSSRQFLQLRAVSL